MRSMLVGRLGGRVAGWVEVSSAGTAAVVGSPMHPLTRAQLTPWGLDSRAELVRGRQLDDTVVRGVDLVLGVDVLHRSVVLERYPHLLDRTFALREFARLAAVADTTVLPPGLVERGGALVDLARAMRGTVVPADDSVPDPMGGHDKDHRAAVELIFHAVQEIVAALAPRPGIGVGR